MPTNKYLVECPYEYIDPYRICRLYDVEDPGSQQAIKKILMAGDRGYKDFVQDLKEAIQALQRSIDMYEEDQFFIRINIVSEEI